jgi:transposase-like protein
VHDQEAAVARYGRWTDEVLRECVAEQGRSGLTVREYARAVGVPYSTFVRWRVRFRGDVPRDTARPGPRLVAVDVIGGSGGIDVIGGIVALRGIGAAVADPPVPAAGDAEDRAVVVRRAEAAAGACLELEIARTIVRVPPDFDEVTLTRLVRTLRAC